MVPYLKLGKSDLRLPNQQKPRRKNLHALESATESYIIKDLSLDNPAEDTDDRQMLPNLVIKVDDAESKRRIAF